MDKKISLLGLALLGCGSVGGREDPTDAEAKIIVSPQTLEILEGASKTFSVLLDKEPSAPFHVSIGTSDPSLLGVSQRSLVFTGGAEGNWATPIQIEAISNVDKNATSEMATLTVSHDGGEVVSVAATIQDKTDARQYGWPVSLPGAGGWIIDRNYIAAFRIRIDADTKIDSFSVFHRMEAPDSLYRMALYRDGGGRPGALVAQMVAPQVLKVGLNTFDLEPDILVDTVDTSSGHDFWLALVSSLGVYPAHPGNFMTVLCNMSVPNITDPWPTGFDPTRCSVREAAGIWINTYSQ